MTNQELIKLLNNNFDTLYQKYFTSEEFNQEITVKNDHPLFIVIENHNCVIKKTQKNLENLKDIIEILNKYHLEIIDNKFPNDIYLECQSILQNIYELDNGINKHQKIFQNLT